MPNLHTQAPLQQEYIDKYNSGTTLNWDIGQAQPVVQHLVESGYFFGHVLDVGCGTGENARCIAQSQQKNRPVEVLAVDFVPKAIEMAIERTNQSQYSNLTYAVSDVLKEDEQIPHGQFDFVLDSCLFHGLSDEHRGIYIHQLHRWLKPSGVYVQLVWSEKETFDRPRGPRKITRNELEHLFSIENGWEVESIQDEVIQNIPELMNGRSIAYLSLIRKL